MRESAARLADQARSDGWSHEDYLAAVLSREVTARESSGTQNRIRLAGLPTRKSLEECNFDDQPSLSREMWHIWELESSTVRGGGFARAVRVGRFEYVQTGETTLLRETIDAAVATPITTAEPTPDCIGPGYDLSALDAALGCYRRSIRDLINKRGPTVVGPIRQATSESLQLRDTGYEL
ncbi:hypothetical protein SAMN02799641_02863 [Rhodococcus erythropolis]|uniref:ATP-binding protein n=1 Tax=Rhodococcus erythropolis TaxID=1833 RepID=UPI000876CAE9|nr:ATP-binding protein [Rhodococcus erythropolis]SCY75889.1 hypothetical protein SAMN02799641_02863 [Rhodococcus erythropolis]